MYKKGDFHLHTNSSDGKLFPDELVILAKNEGLDIIAITDHDNTFGLEKSLKKGTELGIKVVPGIELSTRHNGESIHILGYFTDNSYKLPYFQSYLKEIQDYRISRGHKIVENLKKYFNINIDYNKLQKNTKGIIARPHIAQAIINHGYPYDFTYIFENILNSESPAFVPNKEIPISEGIQVLKSVNAITSLAHPTLLKYSNPEDILNYDFDCIEGIYPLNKPGETEKFRTLAITYNKILTAGSDYHGLGHEDTKHGYIGDCTLTGTDLNLFLNKVSLIK